MPATLVPSPAQIVDEFTVLDDKVKEFAPTKKRHDELAAVIRSWYAQHPADQDAVAEGLESRVLVSARAEQRSLGLKAKLKIFTAIGKSAFVALVDLTLKSAESAVGTDRVEELVTRDRTGARKLVAVAKILAKKAA